MPPQPHRGGAAAFHGGEHCVRLVIALQLPSQNGQGFRNGCRHEVRQTVPEVRPCNAGAVTGNDPARPCGGTLGKEVLHPLGGGKVIPLSCLISGGFQIPLEGDTRQGAVPTEILRGDVHQQGAVDVLFVTGKFAHAVGHHPVFLRRGGHHLSAGTDTEGKGAASVGQVAGQLIGGGRQGGVTRQPPVAGGVHRRLSVLDAHPHGKGLLLHGKTRTVQHLSLIHI